MKYLLHKNQNLKHKFWSHYKKTQQDQLFKKINKKTKQLKIRKPTETIVGHQLQQCKLYGIFGGKQELSELGELLWIFLVFMKLELDDCFDKN